LWLRGELPVPDTAVTDDIDFDPRDWFLAPWRDLSPLPPVTMPTPLRQWVPSLLASEPTPVQQALLRDFIQLIHPSLDAVRRAVVRKAVRFHLPVAPPCSDRLPSLAVLLGAWCGLPQPLCEWVENLADGSLADCEAPAAYLAVFGLPDAKRMQHHFRRLGLRMCEPWHVAGWLAHTGLDALEQVGEHITAQREPARAKALLVMLCKVRAPQAAWVLLRFARKAWAGAARSWLRQQIGNAIAGLVPVAAGQGPLAEEAATFLRRAADEGFDAIVRNQIGELPAEPRERLCADLLGNAESSVPCFTKDTTPAWLAQALRLRRGKRARWMSWLPVACLPPVVLGDHRLNLSQVEGLLRRLRQARIDKPLPLAQALRAHVRADCLDRFAWAVLDHFDSRNHPPRGKWTLTVLTHLGGEGCARGLASLLEPWADEGRYHLAIHALQCLQYMDHPAGLFHLAVLRDTSTNRGIRYHAGQLLDEAAAQRQATTANLIEETMPALGMEAGVRVFDFGPRQFLAGVGPTLQPVVRGPDGTILTELPGVKQSDQPRRAYQARRDWESFREEMRSVFAVAANDLESALICGRRWPIAEFKRHVARHPVVHALARMLLWQAEARGKKSLLFRLGDAGEWLNVAGQPVSSEGRAQVRLAHPLHLEEGELRRWQEVFVQHELLPPFAHLGRPVHRLTQAERSKTDFMRRRFPICGIPGAVLLGTLRERGWVRSNHALNEYWPDLIQVHYRPFREANLTAFLQYEPGLPLGRLTGECPQQVISASWRRGLPSAPWFDVMNLKHVPGRAVAAELVSEFLADLECLAAQGTPTW
jgi:hypothetical protein